MRKQYSFWPSERGLQAWDVDRLIERTRDLPVREIDLGAIWEYDEVYWYDGSRHLPTVRSVVEHMRLVEAADLSYPIILGANGRVMDGMHRVAKARLAGHATIRAVQFEVDPEPDYVGKEPSELPY